MIRRLANVLVPAGVAGAVIGTTYTGRRLGFISPAAWFWLWPSMVAVAFAVFCVLAVMSQARKWLWPLGTGLVVQLVGILLLFNRTFERSWEPLVWTLGAVAVVLLVMLGAWIVAYYRARWLEKKMVSGMGVDRGADQQQLGRIREDMLNALALLRKAGRGRNAIYELPWHLVIGRPAAGKTVAIKNSGLGLPVRKDWVKGVGGTYTCDWFFTNDMIFLDTPGKWVTDGADEDARSYWNTLLKLLRKFRGKRPLDGLVVVVPADDLLSKSAGELEEQAANVRTVIDLLHEQLRFRFPVYLLVSKTDLVEGFTDFFYGLPARRRHEILGWSNDNPNEHKVPMLVHKGFGRVMRRLESFRLQMLAKVASRTRNRRLFFFTEEFKRLRDPLVEFAKVLFYRDPSLENPVFRGFYFTSGTQGEGSPVGQATAQLARSLGIPQKKAAAPSGDEPKRSYFLLELFRDLMVGDEGLVGRTGFHWWRRRRHTMFATFLPAGLAVMLLVLAFISLLVNAGMFGEFSEKVPELNRDLKEAARMADPSSVQASLRKTGEIRGYHRAMTGFTLFRGLGMRRPGSLADDTFTLFRDRFNDSVLRPTLSAAEEFAIDPERTCMDRIDVLHSVVWLRMGRRLQWSDDLAGFDNVWGLPPEEAAEVREKLLLQFGYMKKNLPGNDEAGSLLPGFSIRRVARAIQDQCGAEGSTSALEIFRRFQTECEGAVSREQIENCYAQLHEVLRYDQQNYQKVVDHFQDLKTDLAELEGFEPEARIGLELLESVDVGQVKTGECLVRFVDEIVPEIQSYADESSDLLQVCRDEVEMVSDRGEKYRKRESVLKEQEELLVDSEKDLLDSMKAFSTECRGSVTGFTQLDFSTLKSTIIGHRRVACLDAEEVPSLAVAKPVEAPARKLRLKLFRKPREVSNAYTLQALNAKRGEWAMRLDASQTGYTGEQKRHEEQMVGQEIASFMKDYTDAWKTYLRSLRLESRKGSVSAWLRELSETGEFGSLIGPAADAFSSSGEGSEPPLDTIAQQMRSFATLGEFVGGDLKDYQAMLGQIADDLDRCNSDLSFFRAYKRAVVAGDANGATLASAQKWLGRSAGPGLADGALQHLLKEPLREADLFVRSDNLLDRQWDDLRQIYQADLGGRFPYAGNLDADPADFKSVVAVLGRGSGLIVKLRESIGGRTLTPQASSWLANAEELSRILFEDGSDTPQPLRVRMTLEQERYDPENVGKKIRLDNVRLYMGSDADITWEAEGEDLKSRSLAVALYGGGASDYGEVSAKLSHRKGFVGRVIGSDYKGGKPVTAMTRDGAWAPMKLLAGGIPGGLQGYEGGDLALVYAVPVENEKGKRIGTVNVHFRVEGEGLEPVLRLLKSGLGVPPKTILGN